MEALSATIAATSTSTLVGLGVAAIFVLANAKSLPLAYTVRLLPSLYRLFRPRLFSSKRATPTPKATPTNPTASPALFTLHLTPSRAILLDIDINLHKSNSTFFADADINRAALLTTLLSNALTTITTPSGKPRPAMFILAGVQASFRREIAPFQAYDVSSRVLCWDERGLWVVTYFLKQGLRMDREVEVEGGPAAVLADEKLRRGVYAVMVARYVFKAGRETVSPAEVLGAAGLLVDGGGEGDRGRVERAVESGLGYVKGCML